ncbi:sensor histidine kinase [Cochlodiniinecator piscidefendens]|uniref:sensor histidine kinase n=1 Tax=Cochlodiniinecator piscidefendens TaxID=2715756 RepID=UPI001407C493
MALVLALTALVSLELLIATERWVLVRTGVIEFREAWVDIPFAVGFCFSWLFFAAHLARTIVKERNVSFCMGMWRAIKAIAWPPTKLSGEAAVARSFFYVSTMPLLLAVCLLLRSYGIIDWLMAEVLACWFFLLLVASFALTYLNYVPEQSSIRVKVIGITLISILSILCGISWIVGSVSVEGFKSAYMPSDQSAIRFAPDGNGRYLVTSMDYRFETGFGNEIDTPDHEIELPFEFPFFEESYSTLFVHSAGIIGFDHLPVWRDVENNFGPQPAIFAMAVALIETSTGEGAVDSGLFYEGEQDQVTITWNRLVSEFSPNEEYTFQLRLYRDGIIDLVFKDIPQELTPDVYRAHFTPMMMGIVPAFQGRDMSAIRFSSDLPFETSIRQGVIEYHRLDFLTYLDRIYAPIAYFILASSLAIFLIFPRFFRINLDLPLKQLIWSVQQIMDGKLTTEVGISHRDEIGFLAVSFKKMAAAQSDLILTLEEKVERRTSEVTEYAAKNARLVERNRLSRDLHDAVSQTLFSANLIASSLPDLMDKDPKQGLNALEDIQRLNKEALVEMRQMLLDLRPEKLAESPLGLLLEALAHDIESKFSVHISLQVASDVVLPEAVQLTFYRIAQESLTNAAKHARANQIEMIFDGMEKQAMLSVNDDGIGFDTVAQEPGHMGLQIMNERIGDVGGSLEIESKPGHGCQVTAIWFEKGAS